MKSVVKKIRGSHFGQRLIRARIGRFKAWYQRVALYITGINFLMIFHNFTLENEWLPWYIWIMFFGFVIACLLFIDILFIWESEQETTALKNPVLTEIHQKIDYLIYKEDTK